MDCRVNGTLAQDEVASKRIEADAPIRAIMSSSGRSSCANVSRHPQMSPYFQQLRAKIGHALLLLPSVAAAIRDSDGRLLLQEKASGKGYCQVEADGRFDAQHGGFTTGWSPVSWGSIDELFVNLTMPPEDLSTLWHSSVAVLCLEEPRATGTP